MAKNKRDDMSSFQGLFQGSGEDKVQTEKTITTVNKQPSIHTEKKKGRPKVNRETKKRITFTILQSVYDNASKIAYVEGNSVSEIIGDYLSEYVKKNKDKLDEYEKLIKEE